MSANRTKRSAITRQNIENIVPANTNRYPFTNGKSQDDLDRRYSQEQRKQVWNERKPLEQLLDEFDPTLGYHKEKQSGESSQRRAPHSPDVRQIIPTAKSRSGAFISDESNIDFIQTTSDDGDESDHYSLFKNPVYDSSDDYEDEASHKEDKAKTPFPIVDADHERDAEFEYVKLDGGEETRSDEDENSRVDEEINNPDDHVYERGNEEGTGEEVTEESEEVVKYPPVVVMYTGDPNQFDGVEERYITKDPLAGPGSTRGFNHDFKVLRGMPVRGGVVPKTRYPTVPGFNTTRIHNIIKVGRVPGVPGRNITQGGIVPADPGRQAGPSAWEYFGLQGLYGNAAPPQAPAIIRPPPYHGRRPLHNGYPVKSQRVVLRKPGRYRQPIRLSSQRPYPLKSQYLTYPYLPRHVGHNKLLRVKVIDNRSSDGGRVSYDDDYDDDGDYGDDDDDDGNREHVNERVVQRELMQERSSKRVQHEGMSTPTTYSANEPITTVAVNRDSINITNRGRHKENNGHYRTEQPGKAIRVDFNYDTPLQNSEIKTNSYLTDTRITKESNANNLKRVFKIQGDENREIIEKQEKESDIEYDHDDIPPEEEKSHRSKPRVENLVDESISEYLSTENDQPDQTNPESKQVRSEGTQLKSNSKKDTRKGIDGKIENSDGSKSEKEDISKTLAMILKRTREFEHDKGMDGEEPVSYNNYWTLEYSMPDYR